MSSLIYFSLGSLFLCGATSSPEDNYGWLTPLHGDISEECLRASTVYQEYLSNREHPNFMTAATMLDSNGRLPMEGFLSDTMPFPLDICDFLQTTWPNCKSTVPQENRMVTLGFPMGYSHSPGSFEECLSVNTEQLKGKYCTVHFKPPKVLSDLYEPAIDVEEQRNQVGNKTSKKSLMNLSTNTNDFSKLDKIRRNAEGIKKGKSIEKYDDLAEVIKEVYDKYIKDSPNIPMFPTEEQIAGFLLAIWSNLNTPTIGMCFPAQCNADDIKKNYEIMLADFNFPDSPDYENKFVTEDEFCYTDDERNDSAKDMPGVNILILTVFAIIGVLIAIGSIVEIRELIINEGLVSHGKINDDSLVMKLLKSFSLLSNGKSLMSTDSVGSGHLDCLNGMRFLSMTWVVIGHVFLLPIWSQTITNTQVAGELMSGSYGIAFEALLNALPSVDTFFFMGGTLTAYIMFKELEKAGDNFSHHVVTFIMYYVHRYLRLTIPYALIMGVIIAVNPYVSSGPGWYEVSAEAENCRVHWWRHLLYINTLTTDNREDTCMGVTWYMVCDMIFHWFAPLLFYPMFFLYKKLGHYAGITWWAIVTGAFTFGVGYISWTTRQPPTQFHWGVMMKLKTDYTFHVDFYNAPWARFQPYLVGVLLGYVLHHLKGKLVKIDYVVNILLWQAAFLAAFAVVYGTYDARVTGEMTLFEATMYNTFQRLAWSFSLAWVVFSSVKGFGGIVNDFLSWSAFAPLARLTYCCYLIHLNIFFMFTASTFATFASDFSLWATVMYALAILAVSLCVAAIFFLAFELPFTRVEKILVGKLLGVLLGGRKLGARPAANNTEKTVQKTNSVNNKVEENKEDAEEHEISQSQDKHVEMKEVDASQATEDKSPPPYENQE